jgi:hypothetical protein
MEQSATTCLLAINFRSLLARNKQVDCFWRDDDGDRLRLSVDMILEELMKLKPPSATLMTASCH